MEPIIQLTPNTIYDTTSLMQTDFSEEIANLCVSKQGFILQYWLYAVCIYCNINTFLLTEINNFFHWCKLPYLIPFLPLFPPSLKLEKLVNIWVIEFIAWITCKNFSTFDLFEEKFWYRSTIYNSSLCEILFSCTNKYINQ